MPATAPQKKTKFSFDAWAIPKKTPAPSDAPAMTTLAEVRYPEGLRDVDLSDGEVYGVDWVLLSAHKEGAHACARPSAKLTRRRRLRNSVSHARRPPPPGR